MPFDERCVTSTAKVSVPSICDFLQLSFNGAAGIPDLNRSQSNLGRELDLGFDPELRFSVQVGHMNMRPALFTGKEKHTEGAVTKNRR